MPGSHREPKLYSYSDQYELVMDGQSRDLFLREIGFLVHQSNRRLWNGCKPNSEGQR